MPKREERKNEQTTTPESFNGVQDQGGAGSHQTRIYVGRGLAKRFDVYPNQITRWKVQWLERVAEVFDRPSKAATPPVDIKILHAKIGERTLENDFEANTY